MFSHPILAHQRVIPSVCFSLQQEARDQTFEKGFSNEVPKSEVKTPNLNSQESKPIGARFSGSAKILETSRVTLFYR